MIRVKRVYETPEEDDGQRILVERLWSRGIRTENAYIALWMKEIAPSTGLRKWYHHDPERWEEFIASYHRELDQNTRLITELCRYARQGPVTLIYSALDERHNSAVALKMFLEKTRPGSHRHCNHPAGVRPGIRHIS
jgi:uncharacterized protein YeaO (DUF488 family)